MIEKYKTNNVKLTVSSLYKEAKRVEVLEYFLKTYELYERLFETLADDSVFYERPEALRHPIIFYFGHTAAFYINKLVLAKKVERINPYLESIFAIGVDEMSWDDLNQARYEWPSIEETRAYRLSVKNAVAEFIKNEPLGERIDWDSSFWVALMGCEHERIHLETSSVLIRQLPIDKVRESSFFEICDMSGEASKNELLQVSGGVVKLGKQKKDEFYGWDNEYGSFETRLEEFKASKYLVSNGEFLEFVKSGGYDEPSFWSEEGRAWLEYKKPRHPTFWSVHNGGYRYRALTKEIELPLNWPVDVNYLEAKAYCDWLSKKEGKSLRLPSEAEWYRLADMCGAKEELGEANINLQYASSTPVDMHAHGDFFDVWGNVWQWSETPIFAFEGFETHPIYDDFTAPTFDGRHNLIKGGSFISTGNEALLSARYAFRRHFFQHAGFRYVESQNSLENQNRDFESDATIAEYLEFHYGAEYPGVASFYAKVADTILQFCEPSKRRYALELGCAVGRLSFELAKSFEETTGIDFSARFIKNAILMKESGVLRYKIKTDSGVYENREVCANELGIDEDARARTQFWQGDACNLKPRFRGYDLIVASNQPEKLYDSIKFMQSVHDRLNDGGVFVLAAPLVGVNLPDETLFADFTSISEPIDVEFASMKLRLSYFRKK